MHPYVFPVNISFHILEISRFKKKVGVGEMWGGGGGGRVGCMVDGSSPWPIIRCAYCLFHRERCLPMYERFFYYELTSNIS